MYEVKPIHCRIDTNTTNIPEMQHITEVNIPIDCHCIERKNDEDSENVVTLMT